jgi:hypothetical protein
MTDVDPAPVRVLLSAPPMATRQVSAKLLAELLKHAPASLIAEVLTVHTGVTCLIDECGDDWA